ncbi:MAG: hypothetical protein NZ805_10240 [Armatimonadetes bacterium]|nr:hypothetical protein [Armatimonadota bacterium]
MSALTGIVKNGVIVLEGNVKLPEGIKVLVEVIEPTWAPEEEEEFTAWEQASDEAWALIDQC